jgi:hypothetical protein
MQTQHRTENEAYCVWTYAAVKQPSVRSLPFETERFTPASAAAKNRSRALALTERVTVSQSGRRVARCTRNAASAECSRQRTVTDLQR